MRLRPQIARFLANDGGASAAEFALILVPLILLTIGSINLGLIVYTTTSLHYAAENTARWMAVKATTGPKPNSAAVQIHGDSVYKGAAASPTFAGEFQACGIQVTASADYNFTTGLTSTNVPLTATACYPTGTF
jgi:Flp pilus assembly protein TadG